MKQENSNRDQTEELTVRFGEFCLSPTERLLTKAGAALTLAPKSFDALLLFVREAGRLVRKQDLMESLWPSTFVAEANLTNVIVSLRKALGQGAIVTVSGHGYRFALPIRKGARKKDEWQERFAKARELVAQRSQESLSMAREWLWLCIAEQPESAPAWAWFGRCNWILAKSSTQQTAGVELARAALHRALSLDPELATAHQFTATIESDTGNASLALDRLRKRTAQNQGEAESFAGLVQACRYCGLLPESIDAHQRAMTINPAIVTSLPHTLFAAGDYGGTLDTYGGRAGYYLDAACWAALGSELRARTLLRERLNKLPLSGPIRAIMFSLSASLEGRNDEALHYAKETGSIPDPEGIFYSARHCSFVHAPDEAVQLLEKAAALGFLCAPETLRNDPWLADARGHPGVIRLLSQIEEKVRKYRSTI